MLTAWWTVAPSHGSIRPDGDTYGNRADRSAAVDSAISFVGQTARKSSVAANAHGTPSAIGRSNGRTLLQSGVNGGLSPRWTASGTTEVLKRQPSWTVVPFRKRSGTGRASAFAAVARKPAAIPVPSGHDASHVRSRISARSAPPRRWKNAVGRSRKRNQPSVGASW